MLCLIRNVLNFNYSSIFGQRTDKCSDVDDWRFGCNSRCWRNGCCFEGGERAGSYPGTKPYYDSIATDIAYQRGDWDEVLEYGKLARRIYLKWNN